MVHWIIHLVTAKDSHGLLAIASSVRIYAIAKVTFVLAVKRPMNTSIETVVCARERERERQRHDT
jgi:hypothetical protein